MIVWSQNINPSIMALELDFSTAKCYLCLSICYVSNVCVPLKFIYCILIPNVMVLEDGVFGRWLGHEGRTVMSVLVPLEEWPQGALLPFMLLWVHSEKMATYEPGSSHLSIEYAGALVLDFQLPELWEILFLLLISHSIYGILLYQREWIRHCCCIINNHKI